VRLDGVPDLRQVVHRQGHRLGLESVDDELLDAVVERGVPGEGWVSPGHRDYDYLEWIARLTSHIPDRGTHLVHYYGAYSNAHRGIARRREVFIGIPPEDELPNSPRPGSPWLAARRKSWARLIRRVYEVDSFLCRCGERMRVVGFFTQPPVILKILHHIGWRFDPLN